jgi:hypothetical protein
MIDWSKPIRLTDGRECRVIALDTDDSETPHVVCAIDKDGRRKSVFAGRGGEVPNAGQIENVPEKRVRWLNVYDYEVVGLHRTRENADGIASSGRTHLLELNIDTGVCTRHEVK